MIFLKSRCFQQPLSRNRSLNGVFKIKSHSMFSFYVYLRPKANVLELQMCVYCYFKQNREIKKNDKT